LLLIDDREELVALRDKLIDESDDNEAPQKTSRGRIVKKLKIASDEVLIL
jgi:hypothetical protein